MATNRVCSVESLVDTCGGLKGQRTKLLSVAAVLSSALPVGATVVLPGNVCVLSVVVIVGHDNEVIFCYMRLTCPRAYAWGGFGVKTPP